MALSPNINNREFDKFGEDASGLTGVRILNSLGAVGNAVGSTGGQAAKSVTTSAQIMAVGSNALTNRKLMVMTPTNGTVYWGFTSGVTSSNGQPLQQGETIQFSIGDQLEVYAIAASGTIDVRVVEAT